MNDGEQITRAYLGDQADTALNEEPATPDAIPEEGEEETA